MNELRTSAPGKLMIAGEYSVLFGGTCIVAAIDRYAKASFIPGERMEIYVRLESDLYRDDIHPLWLALTKTAIKQKLAFQPGVYTIDSSVFFRSGTKLGLGSSAAVTAALAKLLLEQQGLDDPHALYRLSHDAHQEFSHHVGSGADSAASSFGTSLRFSRKNDEISLEPLDIANLWSELTMVFTGRSQNTRPLVKEALAYAERNAAAIREFCAASDRLVNAFRANVALSQATAIFEELSLLLANFGKHAGIDIISKEHQEIGDIARMLGGSAKPSGAGGGDLSLALIPKAKRGEFNDRISQAGFSVVLLNQAL